MKVGDGLSYAPLRERLEAARVSDWPFEFWDVEDHCRIRKKFEALNDMLEEVHVIPIGDGNSVPAKRRRLEGETHGEFEVAVDSECGLGDLELQIEASVEPLGSSRVSDKGDDSEQNEVSWKSTVIPKEIRDRYIRAAERLRKDLRDVSLEVNKWC